MAPDVLVCQVVPIAVCCSAREGHGGPAVPAGHDFGPVPARCAAGPAPLTGGCSAVGRLHAGQWCAAQREAGPALGAGEVLRLCPSYPAAPPAPRRLTCHGSAAVTTCGFGPLMSSYSQAGQDLAYALTRDAELLAYLPIRAT